MPELTCDDCRQPYVVWFAPNPIWNIVMGGPDAKDDPGGMLCPRCFTLRAEAAGIEPTAWEVRPEGATETPDERQRKIVAWLRRSWLIADHPRPHEIADRIEANDHMKEGG